MNKRLYLLVSLAAAVAGASAANAQMQQSFSIVNGRVVSGQGAGNPAVAPGSAAPVSPQISEEQKLMFDAPKYVIGRDYKTAEAIYSKVLTLNPSNIEAYLQRAFVRRELADNAGVAQDARQVVVMTNALLQNSPRNATLFYERGQGFRLLKQYDQARIDIRGAIQLSGNSTWDTDVKAIDLEQKMAQ